MCSFYFKFQDKLIDSIINDNLYAEYIMRNAGLDEVQAGIKIAEEISITSDMQMTPPLWQRAKN